MFGLVPFQRSFHQVPKTLFDVDSLFESFFNAPVFPEFFRNSTDLKVDIRDAEKEYILEADLPGLKKEDLHVEFKDNLLTIAVEKNEEIKEEKESYLRRERRMQSIVRSFAFDQVDDEGIKAQYENGVLKVTLPKKEVQEKKHRIEIE